MTTWIWLSACALFMIRKLCVSLRVHLSRHRICRKNWPRQILLISEKNSECVSIINKKRRVLVFYRTCRFYICNSYFVLTVERQCNEFQCCCSPAERLRLEYEGSPVISRITWKNCGRQIISFSLHTAISRIALSCQKG